MSSAERLPDASHRMRHVFGRLVFTVSSAGGRSLTANQTSSFTRSTAHTRSGMAGNATVTSASGVTSASVVSLRHTASACANRRSPSPPNTGCGMPPPIGTVIDTFRSFSGTRGMARISAASPFGANASGVT